MHQPYLWARVLGDAGGDVAAIESRPHCHCELAGVVVDDDDGGIDVTFVVAIQYCDVVLLFSI